nr:hypothetical protein BaRGS_028827 [Batillaria attramentaria]KAG5697984.1 hypothetical protein BaRGS_005802 [Batillaria attramentaria]
MLHYGEREAFVTLATNDTYALGCLVLANSLRRVGTSRQLVVMVTPGVSQSMRNQLGSVFNLIYEVNLLDSRDERNLTLLGRPDLNVTFTKLHCWRLTQFQKCVFLDADTLCRFRDKIKIVHFIGAIKPWHHPYNTATKTVSVFPETGHSQEFLQIWWNIFMDNVQPRLDPTLQT